MHAVARAKLLAKAVACISEVVSACHWISVFGRIWGNLVESRLCLDKFEGVLRKQKRSGFLKLGPNSPIIMVQWKITLYERKLILEGLPWLWEEGYLDKFLDKFLVETWRNLRKAFYEMENVWSGLSMNYCTFYYMYALIGYKGF